MGLRSTSSVQSASSLFELMPASYSLCVVLCGGSDSAVLRLPSNLVRAHSEWR